ncbi:MAG: hypothetical protein V4543_02495 [Bacteroidota bacterium]
MKRIFFILLLCAAFFPGVSQQLSGSNISTFTLEGKSDNYIFETNSMYSYVSFRPNGVAVRFRCKIATCKGLNAKADMLYETLNYKTFQDFDFDGSVISNMRPKPGKPVRLLVNGKVRFGMKSVAAQIPVTISSNGSKYSFSGDYEVNLPGIGFAIPAKYSNDLTGKLHVIFTDKPSL